MSCELLGWERKDPPSRSFFILFLGIAIFDIMTIFVNQTGCHGDGFGNLSGASC